MAKNPTPPPADNPAPAPLAIVRGNTHLVEWPHGRRVLIEKGKVGVVEESRVKALGDQVTVLTDKDLTEQDKKDLETLLP